MKFSLFSDLEALKNLTLETSWTGPEEEHHEDVHILQTNEDGQRKTYKDYRKYLIVGDSPNAMVAASESPSDADEAEIISDELGVVSVTKDKLLIMRDEW